MATAREQGLGAIAVTDHNVITRAYEARAKAAEFGVKIIVAEEVKTADQARSSACSSRRGSCHIISSGTNISPSNIENALKLCHWISQADEELTPTLKVKRNVVYESYADEFTRLYDGG